MQAKGTKKTGASQIAAIKTPPYRYAGERSVFRHLVLANPNYFGNLEESAFPPVMSIKTDTTFEELTCVGFIPEFDRLEAIVFVKHQTGYQGDLCAPGSPEYVRFYLSFDGGANWVDQGMASFQAHDMHHELPLEYDVTLQIKSEKWPCAKEHLAKVRAILSWNNPPPPNTPNFSPVWGNVMQANIQIAPAKKHALPGLDPGTFAAQELESPEASVKPGENRLVPAHRSHFTYLSKLLTTPALTDSLMATNSKGYLSDLGIDPDTLDQLLKTNGNTTYEALDCVGFNVNQEALVGVLTVKKHNGYSGGLCAAGSREYVAFWVDWGDGAGWAYAGTTSVKVHDIVSLPAGGLQYAVFLPLDTTARRRPCENGPVIAKVRAILSWEVAPPAGNPDYVPVWGNRHQTTIQIKPGHAVKPGSHTPVIETVGGMSVADINGGTGLANGAAMTAGFTAQDSPFGGVVVITGHLANPGAPGSLKYKVSVSSNGLNWNPLTETFHVYTTALVNGIWGAPVFHTQTAQNGFYTYLEGTTQFVSQVVSGNVLAHWQTAGLSGHWYIRIESTDGANTYLGAQTITVYLDNMAPTASITLDGGACEDYQLGSVITGTYSGHDAHFGSLSLGVEPAQGGTFTSPIFPRSYPIVPTTGENGTWSFDTTGMTKCGYIIRVSVADRTIVNSGYIGFHGSDVVGLCLR